MDDQKIRSNLKKLVAGFLVIFLLIGAISQYLFRSVTDLYSQSVEGRLEERALQYKKSFVFKMNSDLQTLRAMACMLDDVAAEDMGTLLSSLWDAGASAGMVRLVYFAPDGVNVEMTPQGLVYTVSLQVETEEMQYAVQQAFLGSDYCSQAFYDPVLGYNTLGYAVPVYTSGEVSGVLACSVSTETYADIFSSIGSVSDTGAAAVLSDDGKVLASTRTHQTQGFYSVDGSSYLTDEIIEQFDQALSKDNAQFFQFELNDLSLYAYIMPLEVYSDKIVIVDTDTGISNAASGMLHYARMSGVLFCVTSLLFMVSVLYLNRRHTAQLVQIACHDRLTGANNRYQFFRLLDKNWKKNAEYTVICVNIRRFKYINELFSPANSNQLLQDISAVLQRNMEYREFFCRDTADTFVIALKNLDEDVIRLRLEHIFSEIKTSCRSIPSNYPITFYCGCATTVDCSGKSRNEDLMSHVMLALSHAKLTPQSNISFYNSEIHEKETQQNYIESHMERALQNGQFQMYLQPQMDLTRETLSGAEALVRWVENGKQSIFPDQFIPIFERTGFCIQLDYYMVEQACKQIRAWMDAGLSPVPISVNQSKLLFYEADYVERICAITRHNQVPNHYITLEILEGLALENPDKVSHCIEQLHQFGFRITMDDIGTGYSSLNTLSQLPIDELKLDRSFLIHAQQSTESNRRKILEAVIEVAKRLEISTVAEGIETADNVRLMQELHCDYGQGYYYSRPIPAEEFTKTFLQNRSGSPHDQILQQENGSG